MIIFAYQRLKETCCGAFLYGMVSYIRCIVQEQGLTGNVSHNWKCI